MANPGATLATGSPLVEADGLCKAFGWVQAVDHASFTARAGEVFGLPGPNGAGKTTTLRLLATTLRPTGGIARVAGHDILREPVAVRRSLGVLTAAAGLYHRLSVRENLEYFARLSALLAVAFSARELALSVFARSFKEAQNYITPLYLVALVPVVALTALPTLRPPLGLFLVPAVNAVLVVKEALVGRVDALHVVLSAASLLVFAAAAVAVSTYVFTREQVLFKA
jgi:ABC-type sugar transport system ATPase subunit